MNGGWLNLLYVASTALGVALTAFIGWIRPATIKKRAAEAACAEKDRADAALIDGVRAIPGVITGVPPAALRIQALETGLTTVGTELAGLTTQVAGLAEWQRQANGTAKRIEEMVTKLVAVPRGATNSQVTDIVGAAFETVHLTNTPREGAA